MKTLAGKPAAERFQNLSVAGNAGRFGACNGLLEKCLIGRRGVAGARINAVDAKRDQDLGQAAADCGPGIVAGRQIALCDRIECFDQSLVLSGKASLEYMPPCQLFFGFESAWSAAHSLP